MTALWIDPENAQVLARAAKSPLMATKVDADTRSRSIALARDALARDAGNVTALTALGLTSGGNASAGTFFGLAERLSRRNLVTELWLIEAAAANGDIDAALRHYDIALRTNRSAAAILFPVLVDATSDDRIRPALVRTLARRPLWSGLYLQQLAQSGRDLNRIAIVFADLKRRGIETGIAADAALYDRLIAAQLYDDAWLVYGSDHPAASRQGIRNGGFTTQPAKLTPFDWQPVGNEFVTAQIERAADGQGGLTFSTAADEGGEAVRQTTVFAPGSYVLDVLPGALRAADAPPPYFRVTCLPTGSEIARLPLVSERATRTQFVVPAGCPAQVMTLVVQPASGMGSVEGTVRRIRIDRR